MRGEADAASCLNASRPFRRNAAMTHLCTMNPLLAARSAGAPTALCARSCGSRDAYPALRLARRGGERLRRIARHAHRNRQSGKNAQYRALSPLVWRAQSRLPLCRRWLPLLEN